MHAFRTAALFRARSLCPHTARVKLECKASTQRVRMAVFTGDSAERLSSWLQEHGVNVNEYGKGTAKTVAELLEEQTRSESILDVIDGPSGPRALRIVKVLSLHITNNQGQVLFEDEQILPDGRSRRRNVTVSEKLIGDETWRNAVPRAISEELGTVLPPGYEISVQDDSYHTQEEFSSSMSYPGLLTKYIFHRVKINVTGLPQVPFETYEVRPGGRLITRWVWRFPNDVEEEGANGATSSAG